MRWLLAIIAVGATTVALGDNQRGLSIEQARYLVAASGFTPGTVRQFGDSGRFVLRSVSVTGGGQDFLIRVRIAPLD